MKKIIIVFLIFLIILSILEYRKNTHFSTSDVSASETIIRLSEKISSKDDALKYFTEWLTKETNYSDKDNRLDSIAKYRGYYEIKLKTAITLNSRTSGYMGYRDYVVTKDGYLKGYYYSK